MLNLLAVLLFDNLLGHLNITCVLYLDHFTIRVSYFIAKMQILPRIK